MKTERRVMLSTYPKRASRRFMRLRSEAALEALPVLSHCSAAIPEFATTTGKHGY